MGSNTSFALSVNNVQTAIKSREGSDIKVDIALLVFINDILQINKIEANKVELDPEHFNLHKKIENVTGRHVISNNGYSTEGISPFLDFLLQPLCKKVKSYIKDTNDFLLKLKNLPTLPKNTILCTVDVVGVHPNNPNNEGLQALRHALDERESKIISRGTLLELSDS